MKKTSYNPENLSPEALAQMPIGARLLRDDEERTMFQRERGCKADLFMWECNRWIAGRLGSCTTSTYCTTRKLGWDKPSTSKRCEKGVTWIYGDPAKTTPRQALQIICRIFKGKNEGRIAMALKHRAKYPDHPAGYCGLTKWVRLVLKSNKDKGEQR